MQMTSLAAKQHVTLQVETVLSRIKVYTTHVGHDKRHLAIAPQLPSTYSTDIYNNLQL